MAPANTTDSDQPASSGDDDLAWAEETIAAIATASGQAGIGIVRVSGAAVEAIAVGILGAVPTARHATFARFKHSSGAAIDSGIALYFPAPHSFTGDAVLELQGHGGPVVLELVLQRVLELGARRAQPGEFSQRAYLNGKLDLTRAEAIADLIAAGSAQAARSAVKSLEGAFAEAINALIARLVALRVNLEGDLDFPDEELEAGPVVAAQLDDQVDDLIARVATIQADARRGLALSNGLVVVIVGRPNVGKSTLLNQLTQRERAIVSDTPGTTRDLIEVAVDLEGLPVTLVDTAGMRGDRRDAIENEGMRRAQGAVEKADHVLLVRDRSGPLTCEESAIVDALPERVGVTWLTNKIDQTQQQPWADQQATPSIGLSAKTGAGVDLLHQHLRAIAGLTDSGEGAFSARARHLDALARAHEALVAARAELRAQRGSELVAEQLRLAQLTLAEITGDFTSDDLLGEIFANFCIGK